jgi:hypothetical protein
MKKRLVPYLILVVIVILMSYEALTLSLHSQTEVLSATTTLTTEGRVSALERRVANLEKYTGMVKTSSSAMAKENFVSLSGGSIFANDWTKVPGTDFTFDQSLYGNVTEVSWQGWIDSGNGSLRLYDNTNHRAVDGSEVTVSSGGKASFYSKPLSIWRGQNQYWIEAKSIGAEVILSLPRLKVVTR